MSPLSHDIAGIVLPQENFDSHLDSQGNTIDVTLEKKNFFPCFTSISRYLVAYSDDGYKVDCTALPMGKEFTPPEVSPSWAARHVQQSRYALQIVKWKDRNFCKTFKTNWMSFFPERFVPYPACHKYEEPGLEAVKPKDYFQNLKSYKFALLYQSPSAKVKLQVSISYAIVPFNMYCPSLDRKLEKGICKK